jgi:hypothetical protein
MLNIYNVGWSGSADSNAETAWNAFMATNPTLPDGVANKEDWKAYYATPDWTSPGNTGYDYIWNRLVYDIKNNPSTLADAGSSTDTNTFVPFNAMNNKAWNLDPFDRWAIYKRIMEVSGSKLSLQDFFAVDAQYVALTAAGKAAFAGAYEDPNGVTAQTEAYNKVWTDYLGITNWNYTKLPQY